MAGRNILRKLNAPKGGVPASAAGGALTAGGILGALRSPAALYYAIPGFAEQRQQNLQTNLRAAQGPLNELRYMGSQLMKGRLPYSGPAIGSIPPRTRDNESYRDAELRLSAAARAAGGPSAGGGIGGGNAASFIPYASFGGGGGGGTSSGSFGAPGAERAYQQEASRVAQLAAQNPELQRYEKARQLAVAPGALPETVQSAEDIGMQIWRDKYGGTPMGRTGGAVGAFNPLMQSTFGYQAGAAPAQVQAEQATAAPIPVAPGATPYQTGDLGTRATLDTGYDPAAYGLTPDKIEEMKKKLLLQAVK